MLTLRSIIAGHMVLTESSSHIVAVGFSEKVGQKEERQFLDPGASLEVSPLHVQQLTKQQPAWVFVGQRDAAHHLYSNRGREGQRAC